MGRIVWRIFKRNSWKITNIPVFYLGTNKHRYIVNLLESSDTAGIQELKSCSPEFTLTLKTTSSDIAGIQDTQSYSPGYTITAEETTSHITGKQDSQSYLPVRNITSESQKHKVMMMDVQTSGFTPI